MAMFLGSLVDGLIEIVLCFPEHSPTAGFLRYLSASNTQRLIAAPLLRILGAGSMSFSGSESVGTLGEGSMALEPWTKFASERTLGYVGF